MTYKIQIDNVVRDATTNETAAFDAIKAEAEAETKAKADKAIARQAVLERLGITTDEAALLLG
jgi:hypothetical protein